MQFETVSDFLAMGDHGLYVWLAYGATLVFFLSYLLVSRAIRNKVHRELTWQNEVKGEGNESET